MTLDIRERDNPRGPRLLPRSIIPAVSVYAKASRSLALDSASRNGDRTR